MRQGAGTLLGHSQVTMHFKGVLQSCDHNLEAMLVQAVGTATSPMPKPPARDAKI
jgi:hypothetical protein